jgi:hypothetical protein
MSHIRGKTLSLLFAPAPTIDERLDARMRWLSPNIINSSLPMLLLCYHEEALTTSCSFFLTARP